MARGRAPDGPRRVRGKRKGPRKAIIKKIMQQDVLYLLIAKLPSQDEVQQAAAQLERVMARAGGQ